DYSLLIDVTRDEQRIKQLVAYHPPMTKQIEVVGREIQRREVHDVGQPLKLIEARGEEMTGVFVRGAQRGVPVIGCLRARAAGDAMILDAGETAMFGRRQIRPHVIEIEVEADVAVEIAITR